MYVFKHFTFYLELYRQQQGKSGSASVLFALPPQLVQLALSSAAWLVFVYKVPYSDDPFYTFVA